MLVDFLVLVCFAYQSLYSGLRHARQPPGFSILHTVGSCPLPILVFLVLNLQKFASLYIKLSVFLLRISMLGEMSHVCICKHR